MSRTLKQPKEEGVEESDLSTTVEKTGQQEIGTSTRDVESKLRRSADMNDFEISEEPEAEQIGTQYMWEYILALEQEVQASRQEAQASRQEAQTARQEMEELQQSFQQLVRRCDEMMQQLNCSKKEPQPEAQEKETAHKEVKRLFDSRNARVFNGEAEVEFSVISWLATLEFQLISQSISKDQWVNSAKGLMGEKVTNWITSSSLAGQIC